MLLFLLGPIDHASPESTEDFWPRLGLAALLFLAGVYYLLTGILGLRSNPPKPGRPVAPAPQQKTALSARSDTKEFAAFSDAELVSESDKAWGRGDTERLAAIQAERACRARLNNAGMKTWVKLLCYILMYIIGANLATAFGILGLWAMLLGAAISGTLTPLIDTAVGNQLRRKAQRQQA